MVQHLENSIVEENPEGGEKNGHQHDVNDIHPVEVEEYVVCLPVFLKPGSEAIPGQSMVDRTDHSIDFNRLQ